MSRILIIEDDKEISEIERDYLELDGFEADIANNGITGLEKALSGEYDLVLLDLMLPGMDGFSICKRLREKLDIPILMVTARTQDVDKIRGLGFGADDYIEKPFSPSVLVARVKANLAQYKRLKPEEKPKAVLTVGDLTFDTEAHSASVRGKPLTLTNKEYELLLFLAKHPNQVFGREDLYELIWGLESMGDNITVAVHINRLREKVELDPSHPQMIQTVWGVGYRLVLRYIELNLLSYTGLVPVRGADLFYKEHENMKNHVMTMNYAKSFKRIVILFVILAVITAVGYRRAFSSR